MAIKHGLSALVVAIASPILMQSGRGAEPTVPPPASPARLAAEEAYRAAKHGAQRRDVLIAAIDAGVIERGGSVEMIAGMCGEDFRRDVGTTPEGLDYGIVNFEKSVGEGDPTRGAAFIGWYCVVEYRDGVIEHYYLTNLHK